MPVTLELLGGSRKESAPPSSQYSFTRKKVRESKSPRPQDSQAWKWNGSSTPVFVVRSPINPENWITREERETMVTELLRAGWAFKCRKGKSMVAPRPSAIGWLKLNGDSRRFKHQHSDFGWNRIFDHHDDGY